MKKLFKLTLLAAFMFSSTALFAQKFGRINSQELIASMPETAQANTDLEAYAKELNEQIEALTVEFNNLFAEYQKNQASMTDMQRSIKEKELSDSRARENEFRQIGSEDFSKKQEEVYAPIFQKANDAISKVAKEGGFTAIFDLSMGSLIYVDEAQVTDILPLVKKELGITDTPAPAQE